MEKHQKIRFGILSTANIGNTVIKAIQLSQFAEVICVASRSIDKAKEFGEKHGITKFFGQYQELIDCKDVEAVYIPIPTGLRAQWAEKAILAKKHLIIEKPLPGYTDCKVSEHLLQIAKENNVIIFDGTMWIHSKRSEKILQQLKNNELGEIRSVNSNFTWSQGQEFLENDIRMDPQLEPQGILGDCGWYPVMGILFANQFKLPKSVQLLNWEQNEKGNLLSGQGYMKYDNNNIGFLEFSCKMTHRGKLEITGVKKSIIISDFVGQQGVQGTLSEYHPLVPSGGTYILVEQNGKSSEIECEKCIHTTQMIENFCDIINSNKNDYTYFEQGIKNQTVLCALMRSMLEEKEIFIV